LPARPQGATRGSRDQITFVSDKIRGVDHPSVPSSGSLRTNLALADISSGSYSSTYQDPPEAVDDQVTLETTTTVPGHSAPELS